MAYQKIVSNGTFCPSCGEEPLLLCDQDIEKGKSAFYICHHCKLICEIGVGVVDFSSNDEDDSEVQ